MQAAASSAATISALLLLAVAGGFLFAQFCYVTRFPFRRMEGQQIYLGSAAAAVVLLVLSRLIFFALKNGVLGHYKSEIRGAWTDFVGPLQMPGLLAAFAGAFLLGPLCAVLINVFFISRAAASDFAVRKFGSELEKFALDAMEQALPVSVTLENRKVYVGWVADAPVVEPRKDVEAYLKLVPLRSGYRDDESLRLHITTHYEHIYQRIEGGEQFKKQDGTPLHLYDFVIVLAVDKIVSIGRHALDRTRPTLDADDFALSQA